MKFSQKIVVTSSLLILITSFFLSFQQVDSARRGSANLINVSLDDMTSAMGSSIDGEISSKKFLASSTAEIVQLDPSNRSYVKAILETPKLKTGFMTIGFGYEDDGGYIENDDVWVPDSSYDPRKRPWYIEAKKNGKLVVTEPYLDPSTKLVVISIAVPVYKDSEFIGALCFDVNLNMLASMVNQISLFNAGEMFIVSSHGVTIAHPNAKYNGKQLEDYLPKFVLKEGSELISIKDNRFIVNLTYLSNEDWYIVALIDEVKAFSAVSKMKNKSILLTIIGVTLSIIILTILIKFLMRPLNALNYAIKDVASGQGNLTKRLSTDTDLEFAELADGFNIFTEALQNQIKQSKLIGTELKIGAEQTVESALVASDALHTQLQELEQLATAMHEMSTVATSVADNAQGAASAAKEADVAVKYGSVVVGDTTSAINTLSARIEQAVEEVERLESATANIETIMKVINDIADQINLLALNAAIEAARAGESGRGFAVVADEVRTLAQRTQKSTTEIRTMIEQLQSGTNLVSVAMHENKSTADEVVEKAQLADSALQKIHAVIQHINDMNIQIASSAEEQSLVAEEINNNTVKIKDISTQVSDVAEGANSAMQVQMEKVREQDAILGRFIV